MPFCYRPGLLSLLNCIFIYTVLHSHWASAWLPLLVGLFLACCLSASSFNPVWFGFAAAAGSSAAAAADAHAAATAATAAARYAAAAGYAATTRDATAATARDATAATARDATAATARAATAATGDATYGSSTSFPGMAAVRSHMASLHMNACKLYITCIALLPVLSHTATSGPWMQCHGQCGTRQYCCSHSQ